MSFPRITACLLLLAVVSACGGSDDDDNGNPNSPTPPGGTEQVVTITAGAENRTTDAFGMNPLTISPGTTITWVNNDGATHDPRSDTNGIFNTGAISTGGGRASHTFASAGTFNYHCGFHPNMVGRIVVQ